MAKQREPTEGMAPPTKPLKHTVMGKFKDMAEAEAQCLKDLKASASEIEIETILPPGEKNGVWTFWYRPRTPTVEPAAAALDTRANVLGDPSKIAKLLAESKMMMPIEKIVITGENPRTSMDEEELTGLVESIREIGQKDPVKLRPLQDGNYELISGHRRVKALTSLGRKEVWAVVEETDEKQSRLDMGIANLLREDLNPLDMARWLDVCLKADPQLTQEKIGKICGHNQAWVSNHLRLLKAPPVLQELLISREITVRHVQEVMPLMQYQIVNEILADWKRRSWGISVAELSKIIENDLESDWWSSRSGTHRIGDLPNEYVMARPYFDWGTCKKGCPACYTIKNHKYCLDPDCFRKKAQDALDKYRAIETERIKKAKERGTEPKETDKGEELSWAWFDAINVCAECPTMIKAKDGSWKCLDRSCYKKKGDEYKHRETSLKTAITKSRTQILDEKATEPIEAVRSDLLKLACLDLMGHGHDGAILRRMMGPWLVKEDKNLPHNDVREKIVERVVKKGELEVLFQRILMVQQFERMNQGYHDKGAAESMLKALGGDPAKPMMDELRKMQDGLNRSRTELRGKNDRFNENEEDEEECDGPSSAFCNGCPHWTESTEGGSCGLSECPECESTIDMNDDGCQCPECGWECEGPEEFQEEKPATKADEPVPEGGQ